MDRIVIRRDAYFDSVFLMSISAELKRVPGVQAGQAVLCTPANLDLLQAQGFDLSKQGDLGPTDLAVTLRASIEGPLDLAEKRFAELLSGKTVGGVAKGGGARAVGLTGGLHAQENSNLVVLSVPGEYAAYEALRALRAGLHVMLFSDNVSVEDEIALKTEAVARGLLLMGPDCGTAIINGVMLGFANKVRRGRIGVVGASGTGMQEVTCLIDREREGISQAIGTGGRDLSEKVGGLTTLFAIDALASDPDTSVIVVISKPPAAPIADRVLARLAQISKPSVVHFVGAGRSKRRKNVWMTSDLALTAFAACDLARGQRPDLSTVPVSVDHFAWEKQGKVASQKYLRGLFTGGTLGAEALAYLAPRLRDVRSNLLHDGTKTPLPGEQGHVVIDLGDDEFTRGRPHPMIDPTPRVEWLDAQALDPTVAVVLMDVVLGTGSHADPAGAIIPAIDRAKDRALEKGRTVSFIVSVTGTSGDTQNRELQIAKLKKAGVVVFPSNIEAVRFACFLVEAIHAR